MRTALRILLQTAACFLTFSVISAQDLQLAPSDQLPMDPRITMGKLDNGLTYYIRTNQKPEDRAELRLVVNAGSVLEDGDQLGIAHLVEHMAFNGTKQFAKQQIVDYLESIGMRFGPDINAYTNFDQTVYMLQVPTDSAGIVEKGLEILAEWAHNVAFEDDEIDKERGVVIEEWRIGRGANARIRDQQLPVILKDSRYADRLPIGKKEVLETAPYDVIRRFYRDWYRPGLMAVVAVGDFDKEQIASLIERYFAPIPAAKKGPVRPEFPVPDHKKTLVTIASDEELTSTGISVYYKHVVEEDGTARAYRKSLVENLYNSMFNSRLRELLLQEDPPFLNGFSGQARFVRSKEFYILGATAKENDILGGLETLLTEARRVEQYGFAESELEREKTELLSEMEQAYNERDKTPSHVLADEYIRNFLTGEPLPGIEFEYDLVKHYLPQITLEEVNERARYFITDENRVVALSAPDKEDLDLPTSKDILAVFDTVAKSEVKPYTDNVPDVPLVENPPEPGSIVSENKIPEIGLTELRLSNGVRVILKPTDFQNDEILFTAFSPGGHSLVSDKNFVPAVSATAIIREGGVGSFDRIALQKKLAGKLVSVSPFIGELEEGMSGSAAPKDLETALKLIYLFFTSPRKDTTAFKSFKSRMTGFIQNRHASPEAAFQDTIQVTMADHHFRSRPWSPELLSEMNLETSYRIYQDRFADASDFTFLFVGSFSVEDVKPMLTKYLGGLPGLQREETWRDVGMDPPDGVVKKEVKKGLEPKSRVSIIFTGPLKWSTENRYHLTSMASAFQIKLREVLREELSGTYGVRVAPSTGKYPDPEYSLSISFGCDPERVSELTGTVFEQIDSLKTFGTTDKYLQKVKEIQRRSRETDLKENGFWLRSLRAAYYYGSDPREIINYEKMVDGLTLKDIQAAAHEYFDLKNYVQVVLYPENS